MPGLACRANNFAREVDILCLAENTSIRGEEEIEIEEETFYDLETFILSSQDQITEVESGQLDAEGQTNDSRMSED